LLNARVIYGVLWKSNFAEVQKFRIGALPLCLVPRFGNFVSYMQKSAPAGEGYRQLLLEKKREVLAGLGIKLDALASGDRVAEEDQAQLSHDEFVSVRLNSLDNLLLRLVNEALDRMDSNHFGICLSCDQAIPAKRLDALPWARYCLECQAQINALEAAGPAGDPMLPLRT
jgi:DnaK suppressor protein